jgi:hypothetical protein
MAEIYVNSNSPIKTKIFWAGEIVDPDGNVSAEVYDVTEDPGIVPAINPTTLLLTVTATKLENDFGTYQIVLPTAYTDRNRSFRIVWRYQVGGLNAYHTSNTDVVTPYANLAEAVEDLGIGSDPSDPRYKTYHELQMAEKYARKVIENYCSQSFYLYDDVEVVYGSGSDTLPLPYKLSQLHELYAGDYLLIDNINNINNWNTVPIISETGFGIRVDTQNLIDNTVYIANGMVPPTVNDIGYGGAFKKDVRYRVAGKFGWEKVPDNVEQACIQLMGDFFEKDSVWRQKYVKGVKTFDWQFEFTPETYKGTGNAYADQLLNHYVINTMVVI